MNTDSAVGFSPLPGRRHRIDGGAGVDAVGDVCLYRVDTLGDDSVGAPLLLVHSINAAASAFEMAPLASAQARHRPVIALDLPGFGLSDKPDIAYTPTRMRDAVLAVARWIEAHVSRRPIDIAALSLGCEFAAEAVLAEPRRFASLALISPTGMEARRVGERYEDGATRASPRVRRVLRGGAFGRGLYRALTSRASMRWFLSRMWGASDFDPRLLERGHECAQLPGAHHAPLDFVSGALFTRGVIERYRALPLPVWVAHGTRGSFTDFGARPQTTGNDTVRHTVAHNVFEGGAMPHFEFPDAFNAEYERFIAQTAWADAARQRALRGGAARTHRSA